MTDAAELDVEGDVVRAGPVAVDGDGGERGPPGGFGPGLRRVQLTSHL